MSEIKFLDCLYSEGSRNEAGYARVWRNGRMYYAHRWAYMEAHGEIPEGLNVLHQCDNPPCVNLSHLRVGTQSENIREMYDKGRNTDNRGSNSYIAKLRDLDVVEIRELLSAGELSKDLAARYGVSKATISEIKNGKRYTNV